MPKKIIVLLNDDQYDWVQAQLENRDYIMDKEISENEYLVNALTDHASLRETSKHYMNIAEKFEKRIESLEKACNIHYSNVKRLKRTWNWLRYKFFNRTSVGNYTT